MATLKWIPGWARAARPDKEYKVAEVFQPYRIPTITLVDRSEDPRFTEVEHSLLQEGAIISFHGDSKSGKTVLCEQVLRNKKPISVPGRVMASGADLFWQHIGAEIGVPKTRVEEFEQAVKDRDELAAKLKAVGVGSVGGTLEHQDEQRWKKSETFIVNFQHEISRLLKRSERPILVDDFHYVPAEASIEIIRSLKPMLEHGVTAIFISVPERASEIVRREPDLMGRCLVIKAPRWRHDEIARIAVTGFQALNMDIDDDTIGILTKNSFRNPLLMQHYCSLLCRDLKVKTTLSTLTPYPVSHKALGKILIEVAASYDVFYDHHVKENEDGVNLYTHKSGKKASARVLSLLVLANLSIGYRIKPSTIRKAISKMTADGSHPRDIDIHNVFVHLTKSMEKELEYRSPVLLDPVNNWPYVDHPFFRVYLLWSLKPRVTGEYPPLMPVTPLAKATSSLENARQAQPNSRPS